MKRSPLAGSLAVLTASLALTALGAAPAKAQRVEIPPIARTQFGIGWVGNAPEAAAGAAAYVMLPRGGGFGLYVDAKFDVSKPTGERGYDASVTSRQVADQEVGAAFIKTDESWSSINVALMRSVTPYLTGYAGGGIARATQYDLWDIDVASPVGEGGVVWAEDPEQEATHLNLMAGVLMRMTRRVSAHFGYETKPKGVTVGLTLRLPPW